MVRLNSGTNLKCMQTVSSIHLHQVIPRLVEQVEHLKKSDEPNGEIKFWNKLEMHADSQQHSFASSYTSIDGTRCTAVNCM